MSICRRVARNVVIIAPSALGHPYRASERIRCDWLLPHLNAEKWPANRNKSPEVTIWLKIAPSDRVSPIQILDMCDPAWREGPAALEQTLKHVDLVTVPTEAAMEDFREHMGDYPAAIVRDGHDLDFYPRPREKTGHRYCWFGYSHNWERAKPAVTALPEEDVAIVTDTSVGFGTWFPWTNDVEAFDRISRSSIAVLPTDETRLKSNNREVSAWAMGMAVASSWYDIELYEQDEQWMLQDVESGQRVVAEHSALKAAEDMLGAIQMVRDRAES